MSLSSYPEVLDAPEFVGARAFLNPGQGIPNATVTIVNVNNKAIDVGGYFSTSTPGRLTVPAGRGGYYLVQGSVSFATSGVGRRIAYLRKNGSIYFARAESVPTTEASSSFAITLHAVVFLTPGDWVSMEVFQNSGGNLNVDATADGEYTWLSATYLGPAASSQLLGPSTLIGHKAYQPSGDTTAGSTTSTVFVDVDATNLAVSFVAPPSGKVLIRLSALAGKATTSRYEWNLREAGGNVANTANWVAAWNGSNEEARQRAEMVISGLTPGQSYTYKWGYRSVDGGAIYVYAGGTSYGPAVMEVWRIE